MKEKVEKFFNELTHHIDYWVETCISTLKGKKDLLWSEEEESYSILKDCLNEPEKIEAFRKIIKEIADGIIHSTLTTFDWGTELAEYYKVQLVDADTKEPIFEGSYHEEFTNYLMER